MKYLNLMRTVILNIFIRIRRCFRKLRMRQLKIAIGALIAISCFITILLYCGYWSGLVSRKNTVVKRKSIDIPMRHIPLNEIYKDTANKDKDASEEFDYSDHSYDYLLKTQGCKIPMSMVNFLNTTRRDKHTCDKRAIFLKKIDESTIKVSLKNNTLNKYLRGSNFSHCCYYFVKRSQRVGLENKRITYSPCKLLNDNDVFTLENDFIKVRCFGKVNNRTFAFYEDVYGFAKKIKLRENKSKKSNSKFNVLLLGMDSMSFFRVILTMPRVTRFFKDNYWLNYKGYHKVGDNTFPNIMASLTGKDIGSVNKACTKGMDYCNDIIIWSTFKKAGYVTAYGEDYLRLPDTFSNHAAFHKQPTDHYIRPLYLTGERELGEGSLVCAGKMTSAQQLLDYAQDFAVTYRKHSFFGAFWMNSHSHNPKGSPGDADKTIENFLFQLSYSHVLDNTFIIFLSDHGLRFGTGRMKVESYYDERLPALFLWIPPLFRSRFPIHYKNAVINKQRLVTPYDLYATFYEIYNRSSEDFSNNEIEKCTNCQSLFSEISANRTCVDAGISKQWCSCHKMYPLHQRDTDGYKSVLYVINNIRAKSEEVRTERCWGCSKLTLKNVIRIHYYYDDAKVNLYNVVAFTLMPGNVSYEATVLKTKEPKLIGSVSVISPYRGLGSCVVHRKDRLNCVCQKIDNCH